MTKEEAIRIIENEGFKRYNWFEEHLLREDEVGISYDADHWIVYVTNEKYGIVTGSITEFKNENDALDNFIKRLRTENILYD